MEQAILSFLDTLQSFFNSIFSILKIIVFSKAKIINPKPSKKTCVIIGNGPSFNDSIAEHLDFITDSDIFTVNMFSISEYYTKLKPRNYLLLDEAFKNPNHETAKKGLDSLVQNTTWELNLFVPNKFKKSSYFISEISRNKNIKLFYFNYVIFNGLEKLSHWLLKKDLAMPQCQNVLVATIFKGINLGYKNIYLFGADHTWHENLRLDDNNNLVLNDTHFYGSKTLKGVIDDKSYMASQFLSLHKAFKGYEVLAKYAKYRNVNIFNASKRSYIDVFEKIKL